MSAKFKFGVFFPHSAMQVQYMPSCVRLYGVHMVYPRLSDWTRLQWALHS